jgi:DNA-binding transcriptional ArsR family regulator
VDLPDSHDLAVLNREVLGDAERPESWHVHPHSVNEIAEQFDITQQAVSQHLKVLRDAGLVAVRPQGQRRMYIVRPEGLAGLRDFLAEFWPDSLEHLKQAVESDDGD